MLEHSGNLPELMRAIQVRIDAGEQGDLGAFEAVMRTQAECCAAARSEPMVLALLRLVPIFLAMYMPVGALYVGWKISAV